jgi:hypothetical protein
LSKQLDAGENELETEKVEDWCLNVIKERLTSSTTQRFGLFHPWKNFADK